MDNAFEFILMIVGAISFFYFNVMKKGDGADEPQMPGAPKSRGDAEAMARQRKIQDEIRRKIAERRQATERTQPAAVPVAPENTQETKYDRQQGQRREATQAHREARETPRQVTPPPIRTQEPPPMRTQEELQHTAPGNEGDFNWDDSDNAYESQMEAQLRRITETKRQAERLKKQAAVKHTKTGSGQRGSSSSRTLCGSVRSQLKDPVAARAAFIYGAVLGRPVSERKQSAVPGLR